MVPECGSFGDQVARKPRPQALKWRVSGRKRYLEAQFIIPDRNESGRFFPIFDVVSVIFGHFGPKVTILWVRDLDKRVTFLRGSQWPIRYNQGSPRPIAGRTRTYHGTCVDLGTKPILKFGGGVPRAPRSRTHEMVTFDPKRPKVGQKSKKSTTFISIGIGDAEVSFKILVSARNTPF